MLESLSVTVLALVGDASVVTTYESRSLYCALGLISWTASKKALRSLAESKSNQMRPLEKSPLHPLNMTILEPFKLWYTVVACLLLSWIIASL